MKTVIGLAGLNIEVEHLFGYFSQFASDYITDATPDFKVTMTDEILKAERELAEGDYPDPYLETIAIYRLIADKLPSYDAAVFHGSVIDMRGSAYAITAHSGVGKTTHTRLWLRRFEGECDVLNGDKPILRFIDGVLYACGTPWQGKENYGKNAIRPLRGIAFLKRAEKNSSAPLTPERAMLGFMGQIYTNRKNAEVTIKTLQLTDRILTAVPLIEIGCNMDVEAAEVCYRGFINGKDVYEK